MFWYKNENNWPPNQGVIINWMSMSQLLCQWTCTLLFYNHCVRIWKDISEYFFVRRKEKVWNFKVKYLNRGSREEINLKKYTTARLVLHAKYDHISSTSWSSRSNFTCKWRQIIIKKFYNVKCARTVAKVRGWSIWPLFQLWLILHTQSNFFLSQIITLTN